MGDSPATNYTDTKFRQGKIVMVGGEWLPTHRAYPTVPLPEPAWKDKLLARTEAIIKAEEELKLYNETAIKTELQGHPVHLYKVRLTDELILGYQAIGREGRLELTTGGGFLLLGEQAQFFELPLEQKHRLSQIMQDTQNLPQNFDRLTGEAAAKERGQFIKRLQAGLIIKQGNWLPSHKVCRDWQVAAFPEDLKEPLQHLLESERTQPMPNGQSRSLDYLGGQISWTKWLDTRVVPRDGILDIRIKPQQAHRIELTRDMGYLLDSQNPTKFELPPELKTQVQQVFVRSPNPYSKGKTSFEPASGETEAELQTEGSRFVVGMDESGRGNWAGPLTAAAVYLDLAAIPTSIRLLRDSKSYSEQELQQAAKELRETRVPVGVGIVTAKEINALDNLDVANRMAFDRALADLRTRNPELKIDQVLVDGSSIQVKSDLPVTQITQGERHSIAIAAASIIASATHHECMRQLGAQYPESGFELHKGAGSKTHEALILRNGLTPEHRVHFAPIKRLQRERESPGLEL